MSMQCRCVLYLFFLFSHLTTNQWILLPGDYQKFITDPTIRKFGVVDLDWSNSKQLWIQGDHMQVRKVVDLCGRARGCAKVATER